MADRQAADTLITMVPSMSGRHRVARVAAGVSPLVVSPKLSLQVFVRPEGGRFLPAPADFWAPMPPHEGPSPEESERSAQPSSRLETRSTRLWRTWLNGRSRSVDGSRGNPRRRSPMTFRCISLVPPAIERARLLM